MKVIMEDSRLVNATQLQAFLKGSQKVGFSLEESSQAEKYQFISKKIKEFNYQKLSKKDKRVIYSYLRKLTGYKKAQLYRLMKRAETDKLQKTIYQRSSPARIYVTGDIKLLEQTDEVHLRLSEDATKEILRREFEVFGKREYQTIARISHSHITNLRHSDSYTSHKLNLG